MQWQLKTKKPKWPQKHTVNDRESKRISELQMQMHMYRKATMSCNMYPIKIRLTRFYHPI